MLSFLFTIVLDITLWDCRVKLPISVRIVLSLDFLKFIINPLTTDVHQLSALYTLFSVNLYFIDHVFWLIQTPHIYHVIHFLKDRSLRFSKFAIPYQKIEIRKKTGNSKIKKLKSLRELFSSYYKRFLISMDRSYYCLKIF